MQVTIVRVGGYGVWFDVHAADCRDLKKIKYSGKERDEVSAETVNEVVAYMYGSHIENGEGTFEDYAADFTFHPCTDALGKGETS